MDLFDLVAKITLDSSEYESGVKDAGEKASGLGDKIKKGFGGAAKIGGASIAAVGAAGVALTKTVLDGASKTASYGDNIDKMSQKMGISAQAYQEWDAILQHSGSSIDGMQRGMMTLSAAAEKGSDGFKKLGISQKDLKKMNQEQLFAKVIEGLQGMESGTERTALAQQLLGGAAKELGPLLNTSAKDTEKMKKRVHELGGVMSDDAVKAAAAYQDSLQDMQTAFGGLSKKLFSQFMPSITKVMDGLTEIFTGNGDKGIGMISEGINELVTNVTEKLPDLIDLGVKIVGTIGKAILNNLPTILGAAGKIVGQIVAGLIKALPQLIEKAPEIISSIIAGLKTAWPDIKAAGTALLKTLWNGIKTYAPVLKSKIVEIWGAIKSSALEAWESIKSTAAEMWQAIKDSVVNAIEPLKTKLGTIWEGIKKKISTAIDGIKTKIDTLKSKFESLKTKVEGIADKIKNVFDFKFTMPKIKLPHFSIDPDGWVIGDLLKGTIPTLSVKWYKRAYDSPYVFTKPTLYGFGDGAGGEIVYGRDNLLRDIKEAVKGTGQMVINQYIQAVAQTPVQFASATEAYFEQARWAI